MPAAKTGTCIHCGKPIFWQDATWWHTITIQGRSDFGYAACKLDVIPAPHAEPAPEVDSAPPQ